MIHAPTSNPVAATLLTVNRVSKDEITAQVVLITAATHTGSNGPLNYPADELHATAHKWDGVPVTIRHPATTNELGEVVGVPIAAAAGWPVVGVLREPAFDGHRLTANVILSRAALHHHAPEVLRRLLTERGKVEVSTGVFTDHPDGVARNHQPDHLAILPDQRGACSVADGCGMFTNNAGAKTVKMFKDGFDPAKLNAMPPPAETPLLLPTINFKEEDTDCGCGVAVPLSGGDVAAVVTPPPWPAQGTGKSTQNAAAGDSNNETPLVMPSTQ